MNARIDIGTKTNNAYGFNINANPVNTYDYYEPRVEGRVFIEPKRIGFGGYYSSNYNKKFAYDFNLSLAWANQTARNFFGIGISPRYRFSDKLSLIYSLDFDRRQNAKGYATQIDTDLDTATPNDIILGNRNVFTYSNKITGKYSISSQMNINLALFHYWSYSENKNYLLLSQDGNFSDYLNAVPNQNKDFNNWNIDLSYTWWFTPGSVVSILYRNSSSNFTTEIDRNFSRNFSNLLRNDALSHTLSVSLRYFIDYNQAKNWF